MSKITVLGLGLMGSSLARALLQAGDEITVWNRSPARAESLGSMGARVSPSAADAARDAETVIICVTDYVAADAALEAVSIQGKLLVQLSTGTPREARKAADSARSRGADYLDGAIIAVPSQIGRPESTIFVAGTAGAYERGAATLHKLAGTVTHVGTEAGAAAALDFAFLTYFFSGLLGFYHGARICEAEGLSVHDYGQLLLGSAAALGAMVAADATAVQVENYAADEATLEICARSVDLIVRHATEAKLDPEIPRAMSALFDRARTAGLGQQSPSAIVKLLRTAS
jgi:3-hydroxyisobutyrate dehydrogenase-like beta-hydroxyacid dehydrogenase